MWCGIVKQRPHVLHRVSRIYAPWEMESVFLFNSGTLFFPLIITKLKKTSKQEQNKEAG